MITRDSLRRIAVVGVPWLLPLFCVLVGCVLRLGRFPFGDSPTETDEVGYLSDGLLLIDGETTIHKYAPSGPLTWVSAAFAAGRAAVILASNAKEISGVPRLLRPVAALETSLFQAYADISTLRLLAVMLITILCLVSVVEAYRLGYAFFGACRGVASGLMVAATPIFVELSTETRPYAIAWAFAVIALSNAATGRPNGRTTRVGIFFGLAVGSHVDMLRLSPLLLLFLWRRASGGPVPWRDFRVVAIAASISFLLIAPWYLLHLGDNIRQIITVRILVGEPTSSFWRVWLVAGIGVPVLVALTGLFVAGFQRRWLEFCCGVFLALNAIVAARPSAHGLQHDGALLVMIATLLPLAFFALADSFAALMGPFAKWAAVVLVVAPTIGQGARVAFADGRSLVPDQAEAWVQANIAPGTRVYVEGSSAVSLLPTAQAADRLWAEVADPKAGIAKYEHDTARFGLAGAPYFRVMSSDRIASDRGAGSVPQHLVLKYFPEDRFEQCLGWISLVEPRV